jgi:hypothetical protein
MSQTEEMKMDIYNSAPKGEVAAFKRAIKELEGLANDTLFNIADAIKEGVEAKDVTKILENAEGLTQFEKNMVWGRLPESIRQEATKIIMESKS